MMRVRQSEVGVVIFSHFFLHDPLDAEKHAKLGRYCWACMHAFQKSLGYVILMKFDKHIIDVTVEI